MNADLYCEQLDQVNQSLIENGPGIDNGKGVILNYDLLFESMATIKFFFEGGQRVGQLLRWPASNTAPA